MLSQYIYILKTTTTKITFSLAMEIEIWNQKQDEVAVKRLD